MRFLFIVMLGLRRRWQGTRLRVGVYASLLASSVSFLACSGNRASATTEQAVLKEAVPVAVNMRMQAPGAFNVRPAGVIDINGRCWRLARVVVSRSTIWLERRSEIGITFRRRTLCHYVGRRSNCG